MSSSPTRSIIEPGQGVTAAPMAGVVCNAKILFIHFRVEKFIRDLREAQNKIYEL